MAEASASLVQDDVDTVSEASPLPEDEEMLSEEPVIDQDDDELMSVAGSLSLRELL